MKIKSRKLLKVAIAICLIFVLGISVCALSKSITGMTDHGVGSSGYLYCDGTWSYRTTATTSTVRTGTYPNDTIDNYLIVEIRFDEYNPSSDASYQGYEEGAVNQVSLTKSGWNPDNIYGYYEVWRDGFSWDGELSISEAELLAAEGN